MSSSMRFVPAYNFGDPNDRIDIAEDEAIIFDRNEKILLKGSAKVQLKLIPRPSINIYVANPKESYFDDQEAAILELKYHKYRVEGFIISSNYSSANGISILWQPRFEPVGAVGDDTVHMNNVIFHLFNFSELIGMRRSKNKSGEVTQIIEHVDLSSDEWNVEIKSMFETRNHIKTLEITGGYGLTHIGRFVKVSGSKFSGLEAGKALQALSLFLSFAKGGRCYPVCAVGFDESDNRVWESWSSPRDDWQSPSSWFDAHHSNQLAKLFPGYMVKWDDERWHSTLHEVIYWYLYSNNSLRGIDAGIIMTQAGIERLSYEYAVKDRKLIDVVGFKNLRASDKFRLLFSSLDIPIDIPNSLLKMKKHNINFNWSDSCHALTDVRNSLIHPEHKQHKKYFDAYFETWNLGLWYLELAILRICGYSGIYRNRLTQRWVGEVEKVPWEK